jgi:hypothetical protein
MKFVSIASWTSTLALVSACTTSPDTELPHDAQGGALTGGSAGTTAGTNMMAGMAGMAGMGGSTGGSAGVGGATGGSAGAGGATSGAGGGGGMGDAGTGGGAGKGGNGGAGSGGTAGGMAGTAGNGGSGGAQAGAGAGGMSGKGGAGGAGAANGGAGAGGKGGAGAGSGGLAGTGGTGVLMELANDQPATADSEENTASNVHLAADGNDGMSDTRWCAANGDPHYWQVDLGAVHPLQRIEIDFEYPPQADGASYGYVVTVSSDGTTFSPAIDRSTNTSTSATQTAMFPANTSGRHVRVLITPPATTPSATWASFWEVRILGY